MENVHSVNVALYILPVVLITLYSMFIVLHCVIQNVHSAVLHCKCSYCHIALYRMSIAPHCIMQNARSATFYDTGCSFPFLFCFAAFINLFESESLVGCDCRWVSAKDVPWRTVRPMTRTASHRPKTLYL
jgi:hypothetical protein